MLFDGSTLVFVLIVDKMLPVLSNEGNQYDT